MKPKKVIGWILLISGIIIIFWTLYSSYNIFRAKAQVPEIFKIEEETFQAPESKINSNSPEELQQEMRKMVEEQVREIIPSEFLSKLLNLISWSIFAGILIFGGSRISGIGIKLIRRE